MQAKFYFDQPEIISMIEESLKRRFPQKIVVSGYIEDGAASVTVEFPDGDERKTGMLGVPRAN